MPTIYPTGNWLCRCGGWHAWWSCVRVYRLTPLDPSTIKCANWPWPTFPAPADDDDDDDGASISEMPAAFNLYDCRNLIRRRKLFPAQVNSGPLKLVVKTSLCWTFPQTLLASHGTDHRWLIEHLTTKTRNFSRRIPEGRSNITSVS